MQPTRYWITIALFLALNSAGWVAWLSLSAPPGDLLTVRSLTPADRPLARDGDLRWRFSLPMRTHGPSPVVLVPEPAGQWRWEGDRELVFDADRLLPRGTRFEWKLATHARSRDGFTADDPTSGWWQTGALSLTAVDQVGADPGGRYLLALVFDQPVRGQDVVDHCRLLGPDGHPVALELHGEPGNGRVLVRTEALHSRLGAGPHHELVLALEPGLRGTEGPLPLEAVRRPVRVTDALVATGISAQAPAEGRPSIRVRFSNQVSHSALEEVLTVEPAIPVTLRTRSHQVTLSGDFEPGRRYTVTIADPPGGPRTGPGDGRRFPRPARLAVTVPDRQTRLWFPHGNGFLAGGGERAIALKAMNVERLRVRIHRLYDHNIEAWVGLLGASGHRIDDLGAPVVETDLPVDVVANRLQELRLDLDDLLPDDIAATGTFLVRIGGEPLPGIGRYRHTRWATTAVTCADLVLSSRVGNGEALVWATSPTTASPLSGVTVRWFSDHLQPLAEGVTDAQGLVRLHHGALPDGERPRILVATTADGQLSWLDQQHHGLGQPSGDTGGRAWHRQGLEAWLYSARDLYRPGEVVHLRGILRDSDGAVPEPVPLVWRLLRPDRREWRQLPVTSGAGGTVALDLTLPDQLLPGHWLAELRLPGKNGELLGSRVIRVQDFVPDRLAATVVDPPTAWRLDEGDLSITGQGDWLFGKPAAGQPTALIATTSRVPFTLPDRPDLVFADRLGVDQRRGAGRHRHEFDDLNLDEMGRATWRADRQLLLDPRWRRGPWRLDVTLEVRDDGGRATADGASVLLHDRGHYVGLGSGDGGWLPAGEDWSLELVAVDPIGAPFITPVAGEFQVLREYWDRILVEDRGRFRWHSERRLDPVAAAEAVRIVDGRLTMSVPLPGDGTYVAVWKEDGLTRASRRVRSGGGRWYQGDGADPEAIALALEAEPEDGLVPGSTTQVVIEAPFAGTCLLTVEQDQVRWQQVLTLSEPRTVVTLPITADWGPNAYLTASVVRPIDADGGVGVRRARGLLPLTIAPGELRLSAELEAPKTVEPFTAVPVTLRIHGATGAPLPGARATIAVVDEGILRLTRFRSPDPLAWRTAKRRLATSHADAFSRLLPEIPGAGTTPEVGGDAMPADLSRYSSPVASRDLRNLAWQSDWLTSDETGTVTASIPVAAFTGAVRVMAVVHHGDRYRGLEAPVRVTGPLQVLASWPRFAAPGDEMTVPVTVFLDEELRRQPLRVELTGDGFVTGSGQEFPSTAGEQELLLPLTAGNDIGSGSVTLTVRAGDRVWTEQADLPRRPPSPATSAGGFELVGPGQGWAPPVLPAVYDGGQTWILRAGALPDLGLTRGLEALQRYPYGCAEQTVSTCLPLIALAELAPDLGFDRPTLNQWIQDGIARLQLMQTTGGGLAMWPGQRRSWPWASAYAAHFLVVAEQAGHPVPAGFKATLLDWCERHADDRSGDRTRQEPSQAYAVYALALAGRESRQRLAVLQRRIDERQRGVGDPVATSVRLHTALGWLAVGRRDLAASLLPQRLPSIHETRDHRATLASPVRDRALLLNTLLQAAPDHGAIPGLVDALARDGAERRWRSTQDQAFALLALARWRRGQVSDAPHGGLELIAGDQLLATAGDGEELRWRHQGPLPTGLRLRVAAGGGPAHLAWLRGGVPVATPTAGAHGMTLTRSLETTTGTPLADGRLASGEAVIVTLTLTADQALANVVVEDLLPAGLEVEHPDLATSRAAHDRRPTPARLQRRDDRVVWFTDLPGHGRPVTLRYLARATVPGRFVWPPARAEAMYDHGLRSITSHGSLTVHRP